MFGPSAPDREVSVMHPVSYGSVRIALLMLLLLAVPSIAFSQSQRTACPPPPSDPTLEEVQAMLKASPDRGFLWRYDKDGHGGYLYGSIHVSRREWMVPGPNTMAALKASHVIALELDVLDPEIQRQLIGPPRSGRSSVVLPPALQHRMDVLAERLCAPIDALSSLHPVMQLTTMAILQARFSDLEVGYGTEVFLSGFGRAAKKPITSLETPELQMKALISDSDALVLEAIGNGLTLLEKGGQGKVTDRLVRAWATSNLSELERYEEWCDCAETETDRQYLKRLLDDRNPHLAAGVDRLSREGRTVFAAVGSLHMIGPNSVPKLLEKMGYSIQRVRFEERSTQ
jgi:uncharacterized protein